MKRWGVSKWIAVALSGVAANGMNAAAEQADAKESIYVVRSIRESRVAATDFCAESRTGFTNATFEDRYIFRSITIRPSDGLLTSTNIARVASGHACLGPTQDSAVLNFYMEGAIGVVSYRGRGDCRSERSDYPEPGVSPWRCFLDLRDTPGYVGGQLATNTVNTRALVGEKSDPPGYTQPSIAVIRLWKHDRSKSPRPAWDNPPR
jgi:hypothetical protein